MKEAVYEAILTRAVTFANEDNRKPWYLGGDIFRTPVSFESLELWYDPQLVHNAIIAAHNMNQEVRTEDEVIHDLTVIVRDAVVKAIREEGQAFGALIVDRARTDIPLDEWF